MKLLDLVTGSCCCHCASLGEVICSQCRWRFCQELMRRQDRSRSSFRDVRFIPAAPYVGVVRSTVLAAKRTGNPRLTGELARAARMAFSRLAAELGDPGEVAVVPIPSGLRTRSAVGADLPLLVATNALAAQQGWLVDDVLLARQFRRSQKSLSKVARLAGPSFRTRPTGGLGAPPVVVFDDVVTTGASMQAAMEALEKSGRLVVGACAVADVS